MVSSWTSTPFSFSPNASTFPAPTFASTEASVSTRDEHEEVADADARLDRAAVEVEPRIREVDRELPDALPEGAELERGLGRFLGVADPAFEHVPVHDERGKPGEHDEDAHEHE